MPPKRSKDFPLHKSGRGESSQRRAGSSFLSGGKANKSGSSNSGHPIQSGQSLGSSGSGYPNSGYPGAGSRSHRPSGSRSGNARKSVLSTQGSLAQAALEELLRDRPPPEPAVLDAEVRARATFLGMVIAASMVIIFLRGAYLMALPHPLLEKQGDEQFQRIEEMTGRRGALYDREGRELAVTVSLPSLYVNPARLAEAELKKRLPELARLTGLSEEAVLELVNKKRKDGRPLQRVLLGKALEPVAARSVIVGLARDEMWLEEESVRLYPGKELASPLLGYVGADNNGAAGLEKVLDQQLAGDTYRVMMSQDRKGRSVAPTRDEQRLARQGNSVRLTIDASIQHATEVALWRAMVTSAPEAAMAVVMDVRTGAVLAIASVPSGNPNDIQLRSKHEMFKNHAAMDMVEPGSVMKPFVAAAAIEEREVTSETLIDCELGAWAIDTKTIHDDHPKGVISVRDVIKYSSNIGTAKMAFMLGGERTINYLKNFGFGRPSGLKLPGEVAGLIRSPATIRRLELATTAFGQGVTASPIQLVAAAAALANGGVRMQPYLVDAILDRHGDVETSFEPRIDRRVVSEDTARITAEMMMAVTEEGGTGTRARVPGYPVAGKTGTAQKAEAGGYSTTKRVSSFVGFLPADNPVISITVVVDSASIGSRYGGIVAAPVFSEIGAFTMRYLGVEPTEKVDPHERALEKGLTAEVESGVLASLPNLTAPVVNSNATETTSVGAYQEPITLLPNGSGGWILPDLTGRTMRAVLVAFQPTGIAVRVEGNGQVVSQSPPAGSNIAAGDAVMLSFK